MGNGAIMEAARKIIDSGEVPEQISRRLQTAISVENAQKSARILVRLDAMDERIDEVKESSAKQKDFTDLKEKVDNQDASTKFWTRAAVLLAAIITAFGAVWQSLQN